MCHDVGLHTLTAKSVTEEWGIKVDHTAWTSEEE